MNDALGATRERRERPGVVEIAFDQLDIPSLQRRGAGEAGGVVERRLARAHQGRDPIATPELWQGSARNIAATDDQ